MIIHIELAVLPCWRDVNIASWVTGGWDWSELRICTDWRLGDWCSREAFLHNESLAAPVTWFYLSHDFEELWKEVGISDFPKCAEVWHSFVYLVCDQLSFSYPFVCHLFFPFLTLSQFDFCLLKMWMLREVTRSSPEHLFSCLLRKGKAWPFGAASVPHAVIPLMKMALLFVSSCSLVCFLSCATSEDEIDVTHLPHIE